MYSQSNFFYGGINTDDEDRFMPKGDYRDALYSRNYGINTSDEGALQSMNGNMIKNNPNLPFGVNVVIGACEDSEGKGGTDTGNLILFVYNTLSKHTIWRYNVQTSAYTKILESDLLNFQLDNKIYHAAVVDGKLYWTDNYFSTYEKDSQTLIQGFNPPRKLNIQKAILYSQGDYINGYDGISFETLDWIKYPPMFSPIINYITDNTRTTNYLKNKLFQFRYQYIYDDNEESAWSPISKLVLPNTNEYITSTTNINPSIDNCIQIHINAGSPIVKLIRIAYRIGNTGEFFIYGEYDPKQLEWPSGAEEIVNFYNEVAGIPISNSERNYDLVPQVCKTIEYLPSNEFAIGNGIEGYDKPSDTNNAFQIEINRFAIEGTSFTTPLADFINCPPIAGTRPQVISLNNTNGFGFVKYRFEKGDIIVIQLKNMINYLNNSVAPDPVIYFEVPEIDANLYPSDQDKIKHLSELLADYLFFTYGIQYVILPPNYISSNINWWTLEIKYKTWFNQTEAQINDTSDTQYTQKINVLRDNYSKRTFKTGATHEFGIQYYDRANRDGTVVEIPVGSVYNPFYTDLTDAQLNGPLSLNRNAYTTEMSLTISNSFIPPDWATHYQIVYKPSTNIANFQQRSVKQIIYNPDTTINLVLEDYYKSNVLGASINQTPSQGDFVRFIRQRALFNKDLIDLNLFSFNLSEVVPLEDYAGVFAVLDLSSFIDIAYNPDSTMSGGVFLCQNTGTYYFNTSFNAVVSGLIDTTVAALSMRIFVNGIETSILTGDYEESQGGIINFNISNGPTPIDLNFGDLVTFQLSFNVISYTSSYPANITISVSNSSFNISNQDADYDNYKYNPKYMTSDSPGKKELNVLNYNPAGGPNGEEMITVDYFDSSILGIYLTYTGTSPDRTLASGGFQIEIYTPKKELENDPWYETGIEFPILNANKSNRAHGGNVSQLPNVRDAIVNLDCGDIYIRRRIMSTGYDYEGSDYPNIADANDNNGIWFCEDPYYSDFYQSNWNNKGRLAIYSPFAKRQRLKATIYHTKSFIDNTQVNGLSRVEFQDQVALRDENGEINKLVQLGDVLKAFQDRKVTSLYIQKTFALNGDGTNNVIVSDRTFGAIRPHDDDYGTIHPGSVSRVENDIYFYDYFNSAFVVVNQGGMFNICETDKKFSKGARDLTTRIGNVSTYGGYKNANIWSHINRNNNEYTFYVTDEVQNTIPVYNRLDIAEFQAPHTIFVFGDHTDTFVDGFEFHVTGALEEGNNGYFIANSSTYNPITNYTDIRVYELVTDEVVRYDCYVEWYTPLEEEIAGEALSYSYERQRWITRLDHGALFATQFGAKAFSTGGKDFQYFGCLFEENFDGSNLSFYNIGRQQVIEFIFNDQPLVNKRFLTHLQQSNRPFSVDAVTPVTVRTLLGQYKSSQMSTRILESNLKEQEGYYVSRYFRDLGDPRFSDSPEMARMNGRELRGYILRHTLRYGGGPKSILMSVGVNYVPSEPLIQ